MEPIIGQSYGTVYQDFPHSSNHLAISSWKFSQSLIRLLLDCSMKRLEPPPVWHPGSLLLPFPLPVYNSIVPLGLALPGLCHSESHLVPQISSLACSLCPVLCLCLTFPCHWEPNLHAPAAWVSAPFLHTIA